MAKSMLTCLAGECVVVATEAGADASSLRYWLLLYGLLPLHFTCLPLLLLSASSFPVPATWSAPVVLQLPPRPSLGLSLLMRADNTHALAFYTKAGYSPDEIDPTRIAEEDGWEDVDEDGEDRRPDYRILSKALIPSP